MDGFRMQCNYLYCVFIGRNCFQEMILTQTLQVLLQIQQIQQIQPGGRGSCRSSRSSQPVASAGRGGFRSLLWDARRGVGPDSQWRLAEAAELTWHPPLGSAKASWRRLGLKAGWVEIHARWRERADLDDQDDTCRPFDVTQTSLCTVCTE